MLPSQETDSGQQTVKTCLMSPQLVSILTLTVLTAVLNLLLCGFFLRVIINQGRTVASASQQQATKESCQKVKDGEMCKCTESGYWVPRLDVIYNSILWVGNVISYFSTSCQQVAYTIQHTK